MTHTKKYVILHASTLSGLERRVNEHLQDGYVPVGGMAFSAITGSYYQAMLLDVFQTK